MRNSAHAMLILSRMHHAPSKTQLSFELFSLTCVLQSLRVMYYLNPTVVIWGKLVVSGLISQEQIHALLKGLEEAFTSV